MTSDGDFDGPGRATSPAFAYPVARDFDGGLLRRWCFVLTSDDALAYLRLRRDWTGRARLALGLTCFAGGVIWGLSPWADAGAAGFLLTESVLIAMILAGLGLARRQRARRMVRQPRPGVLEEWTDCIAGTELDSPDEAYLSPELIGEVLLTRTHLFIRSYNTTLVVPRHALGDEAEAVAAHIRALSRGPYYFDAPLDAGDQAL